MEGEAPAAVLLDEREGGGTHLERVDAEPFGEPLDEGGLACAEVAREQHHVVWAQFRGEGSTGVDRLGFRVCRDRHCLSGALRRAVSSRMASLMCAATSPATIDTSPSSACARSPAMPCR